MLLVPLALWGAMGLDAVGVIDSTAAALVTFLGIGYGLGWIHAAAEETRARKREAVAVLGQAVDQMGTVLAEEELDDDQREAVQAQRAGALELLGLMDRPPLRQRVLARIRR